MSNDLAHASAVVLVDLFRRGAASPVEAAREALARIDRHNATLNCFCLVDEDTTLAMARASEARWRNGTPAGAVDGVPTTIKDLAITRGWPTRRGSRTSDPKDPGAEDAPSVANLRAAGAVFIGKTTTPEFGWKGVTDSPLTGITRNPWNTTRTPGGSSGGAGAACAAFLGALHQGSDGGGSIRIPAAFSGIFGIKPTYGTVPNYPIPGHIGTLAHYGPMARSVGDAALMLTAMSSMPDRRDFVAPPMQGRDFTTGLEDGVKGLRVAYSPTLGGIGWADDDVAAAVATGVKALADAGAIVEQVDPPVPDPTASFEIIWCSADAFLLSQIPPDKHALLDPGFVAMAARGQTMSAVDVVGAYAMRYTFGTAMAVFFEKFDLLVTPQMPLEAFEAGHTMPPGRKLRNWMDWSPFTPPFNLTTQPACSVPVGLGDEGLPIGMQIVGRHFDEPIVLRAARAVEQRMPFATVPGY